MVRDVGVARGLANEDIPGKWAVERHPSSFGDF